MICPDLIQTTTSSPHRVNSRPILLHKLGTLDTALTVDNNFPIAHLPKIQPGLLQQYYWHVNVVYCSGIIARSCLYRDFLPGLLPTRGVRRTQ